MYGFGVLGRGPPGVSRALHCQQRKKLKKKRKKERPVEVRFWILKYKI